jgi:transcription elongation factor GreB
LKTNSYKNYITPEGFAMLEAEFNQLVKVERPELVKVVAWAAGNGDRSENGDYIYGKRRLRQIDARLRFLLQRIDQAEVVDNLAQAGSEKVFFGAWVTLYHLEQETEHHYRIVGQDELHVQKGYISWISPLAKSLLGKTLGDIVRVETPLGEDEYEILEVEYKAP